MVKMKYTLERWERALVFQILEMSDVFRGFNGGIKCDNNFEIFSAAHPDIAYDKKVYLLGKQKDKDLTISIKYFGNNQDRDRYFEEIQNALAQWSQSPDVWDDTEFSGAASPPAHDGTIITL